MMPQEHTGEQDRIASTLRVYAQNILIVIFGLLPLILIPTAAAPFEYTKVFVVVLGAFLALILWGLSVLRTGMLRVSMSYVLGTLWLIAGAALVSGLLSGDRTDALLGDFFSIHSVAFVALLAFIPSLWVLLRAGKGAIMRLYTLFGASTIILVLFHIIRILFGANALSFGLFTNTVVTPVGSWNDLGLFLGLVIMLSLVALEQLSLTRVGKIFFGFVTLGGLFMLAIINFFTVWVILGLISLVMVVFTLGRDPAGTQLPLMGNDQHKIRGAHSLWHALTVFLVSVLFIVGGSTLGGWVSNATGISYVEVRPSFGATMDIARAVYSENALLGAGTNRFADVWRLYKDDSINSTLFWNTDFNAGNGYISTFFVTTGALGGILWIVFLVTYAVSGVRRLLSPAQSGDRMWYFIALSSFLSALYVWGISIVYVPGATILLIGALCTGISLHAFSTLGAQEGRVISVVGNRRGRFVLTLGVVILIITSVGLLYGIGRHYSAVYSFNVSVQDMQSGADIGAQEAKVASAYELFSSDTFARRVAEYQLARMNALVGVTDPTEADQQQFNDAVALGINAAEVAIANDRNEPANWSLLGNIYGVLASVNVQGAYDRAVETLTRAQELNPKNPLPYLELAVVEARGGNMDQARAHIDRAIQIKPNFVEAFLLLSQLEIANGNTTAAIQSTQATITLEPNNPARYYQLGVLARANNDTTLAITALERAVALDTDFANARYHLALAYDEAGRAADAKVQLEHVLRLNPDNEEITNMISVLENEGSLASLRTQAAQSVSEQTPVTSPDGTVHTTGDADSSLVTPVNTPPKSTADTTTDTQSAE